MNNKWYINKSKQLKEVEKTKGLYSSSWSGYLSIHMILKIFLNFKVNDTSPIYICLCKLRAVEIVLPEEPGTSLKNQLDVSSFWCQRHMYLRLYLLVLQLQITSLTTLVWMIPGWDLFISSEDKVITFNCNITYSCHKD